MPIQGFNHVVLLTNDMEKTVLFYRDVLNLPIVAATGNSGMGGYPFRHYFFEVGSNATLAFFEWPDHLEEFHKPAGLPFRGRLQFDHISFDIDTEGGLLDLQERLQNAGVEVTPVVDHKFLHSIYFTDPNGIALEASVWITNPTGHTPQYSDKTIFHDEKPVPALKREMEQTLLIGKMGID